MAKQILVIIDPQNDFTHVEGYYAKKHTGIAKITAAKENISNLLKSFDQGEIIIVRSDYKPERFEQGVSVCIPGTSGHEIDSDFQIDDTMNIAVKTAHSCFSSAAFRNLLRTGNADTLILCGFLAEYCVKQTAIDALALGYNVFLVDDCIATGDDVHHRKQETFSALKDKGAVIIQCKELRPVVNQISG